MDFSGANVTPQQSPEAYKVLKESTDWGAAQNAGGSADVGDAVAKLHELLNATLVALANVEARLNSQPTARQSAQAIDRQLGQGL